jgi:ribose 5-phosphate isomerase B
MIRAHNNANMLALGARVLNELEALQIVEVFLNTEFEGGRHGKRVDMIDALEG